MSAPPFALVTGASGGVGGAVARRLALDGWTVLATGRSDERLGALGRRLVDEQAPGVILPHRADLRSTEDRRRIRDLAPDNPRGLDALVLAHGIFRTGLPERGEIDGDEHERGDDLEAVFDTNLTSKALLFRDLLPDLRRARGQVFVMNSTAALSSRPDSPAYAAAMAGCSAFFRALGGSEGVIGRVRICSIFLGRTATPMQERMARLESRPYEPDRILQPERVAAFVADRLAAAPDDDLSEVVLRATPPRG